MTCIVKTDSLSKIFGNNRAVDNISVEIKSGRPTGLIGPNGAGKTTFFSLLCGFLKPTQGSASILGCKPASPELNGRVAILPQDAQFHKGIKIKTQLRFMAELQGFSHRNGLDETQRVLDLVGLGDAMEKVPEMLSHGMYKRIAIAQAFIGEPELIFMDEPTAGLDPTTANKILTLIRAASDKQNFVVSSHNMDVIEDICDSLLILSKGRLSHHQSIDSIVKRTSTISLRLEQDPPANIAEHFKNSPRIKSIKAGKAGEHSLLVHYDEQGEEPIEIIIIACLKKAGLSYREMTKGKSLDKSFSELTE